MLTDNNELFKWVAYGRISNPKARLSIKGDGGAKYPVVRAVFATLANKEGKLVSATEGQIVIEEIKGKGK